MSLILAGAPYSTAAPSFTQTFTVTDTDLSSPGFVRIPLHFKKGDVPSGYIPKVSIQGGSEITAVQFSLRTTWSDGSLKRTVCCFRDSSFSGVSAETRTYDVTNQAGSYNDTAAFTTSDISSNSDLNMDFTNVYKADNYDYSKSITVTTSAASSSFTFNFTAHGKSTGDKFIAWHSSTSGPDSYDDVQFHAMLLTIASTTTDTFTVTHPTDTATSGGTSSAYTMRFIWFESAQLNDHEAVLNDGLSTYVSLDTLEQGDICCGWRVTQKVKDSTTTSLDANFWCTWYVWIWNDGSDTVNDNIEFIACPKIVTYDVAGRAEMNYTATLKDSTTTIQAYSDINNMSGSWWGTVRMTDDEMHGQPWWYDEASRPTLIFKHDADYMAKAKVTPPYPDIGGSISAYATATYDPMHYLGYRRDTNTSGSYTGRGPMNPQDVTCLLKGDATTWRRARVDAWHGAHYPIHFREDSDTQLVFALHPKSAGEYDFTGDGLEAAREAYGANKTAGTTSVGWWSVSTGISGLSDSSHQMSPAFGQWLLTGYYYYFDMMQGLLHKTLAQADTVQYLLNRNNSSRYTAWSIPATQWGGTIYVDTVVNYRYLGWSALILGQVAGTCPDDDKHYNYFQALEDHSGDFFNTSKSYLPTAFDTVGCPVAVSSAGINGPRFYFYLMNGINYRYNAMLTENADFEDLADDLARFISYKFQMNHDICLGDNGYNGGERIDLASLDPSLSTPHTASNMYHLMISGTVDSGTDELVVTLPNSKSWAVDDKIIFQQYDGEKVAKTVPTEVAAYTEYWVVAATGSTRIQISATQGGSAITFGSNYSICIQAQWADEDTSATSIDGDDYDGMLATILRMAHNENSTTVDASLSTELETWATNESYSGATKLHYSSRDLT